TALCRSDRKKIQSLENRRPRKKGEPTIKATQGRTCCNASHSTRIPASGDVHVLLCLLGRNQRRRRHVALQQPAAQNPQGPLQLRADRPVARTCPEVVGPLQQRWFRVVR